MGRLRISTIINDGNIEYKIYDNVTKKLYRCGVGELNNTIYKILDIK